MGFYDDYKLQASDYTGHDISGLADVVSGQAATLKARFDSLVKDVVAARFNALLSALDNCVINHPFLLDTNTTSRSITTTAWTAIHTMTGLDPTKKYLVIFDINVSLASQSWCTPEAQLSLGLSGTYTPAKAFDFHVWKTGTNYICGTYVAGGNQDAVRINFGKGTASDPNMTITNSDIWCIPLT